MSSGNFIIGRGLKLEGFNQYIRHNLEKYKTKITDILSYEENNKKRVLVSLIGDANSESLERVVKISLEEAIPVIKKDFEKGLPEDEKYDLTVWPIETGDGNQVIFNTIGLYSDNKTASKIFQNLAVKYSLIDLESQLEKQKIT